MERHQAEARAAARRRLWGVYPALVSDIRDPEGQGRVKVTLPWAPDDDGGYEVWARLAVPMAGNQRGTWWVPDPQDEVLVAFAAGDPRLPYVIGALWNGSDAPPEEMDEAGDNNKKTLRSRNGIKVTLDDDAGRERLTLETPGGQTLTLKDGPGAIEIEDANGNSVKLESSGVTITAAAKLSIQAGSIDMSAGLVKVDAGMSKFSGVVKSDVNITNSTVSASYTPGAGNIW